MAKPLRSANTRSSPKLTKRAEARAFHNRCFFHVPQEPCLTIIAPVTIRFK